MKTPTETYPIRKEATQPVYRPRVAPIGPGKNPPQNQPARGFFRVTLNGFRVNNESDDDILEGDGRGDEIFITTNNWMVHKDGTYQSFRQSKTKVMGDANAHRSAWLRARSRRA